MSSITDMVTYIERSRKTGYQNYVELQKRARHLRDRGLINIKLNVSAKKLAEAIESVGELEVGDRVFFRHPKTKEVLVGCIETILSNQRVDVKWRWNRKRGVNRLKVKACNLYTLQRYVALKDAIASK